MGFEPTTLCLGSRCATTALHPLSVTIIIPESADIVKIRQTGNVAELIVLLSDRKTRKEVWRKDAMSPVPPLCRGLSPWPYVGVQKTRNEGKKM